MSVDTSSWDAVEHAEHLAAKDVTPLEVIDAAIARAEKARSLNALWTETFDRARDAAKKPLPAGLLAGVPFATKDLAEIKGVRTTWGCAATGNYISKKNSPCVNVFEQCGLVSLGKTSTPEHGLTATTEPLAFGPTQNPAAPGHTAGGSSGGAASVVAGGIVPIAHGSDGGGSVRIPAACCGLVGLKVTRGRFDMEGSALLPVNIAVHGVLSRNVRDTVAFWRAVEQVRPPKLPRIGTAGLRPAQRVRIGMFTAAPENRPVDAEVIAAVQQTGARLRALGHEVIEMGCPVPDEVSRQFIALWGFVAWTQANAGRLMTGKPFEPSKLESLTLQFAKQFTSNKWGSFVELRRLRGWTKAFPEKLKELDVDVLLSPTLAKVPVKIGHLKPDVPFEEALERLWGFCPFTPYYNSAGAPALSLPVAKSSLGVPIGVQLGSSHGREALLLELGAELEAAV